jgi:glycosyltransferase involved in cell wall biosynthesis
MIISNNIEKFDLLILGQAYNSQTERLEIFFKNKFNRVCIICFNNIFNKNGEIFLRKYTNKKLVCSKKYSIKYKIIYSEIDILINFCKLFFKLLKILRNKRINIAIGIALFSSIVCLYLKIKKNLKKYVYFCLDYYLPNNKLINKIYIKFIHILDKLIAHYAFKTWSISYRLARLRNISNLNKNLIVPNGCLKNFKIKPYDFSSKKIVFVGTISHNHALPQLLEVLEKLNKSLGVNLEIIGSGPNDNEIKKKIMQLNLGKIVKFHGFIKSNDKVNRIIQSAAICYSVWTNSVEDNSSLADPGKPKLYTSLDRPMIISDNVYISKFIKKFNAGIVIKSKKEEIFYSLDKFFRSIKKREEILKNIHIIKKMWDTNKILNKAYLSIR